MNTKENNTMGFSIPEDATTDERRAIFFQNLYTLNLNDKVEKKNNLTYLTWSVAWAEFKKIYPSASFRVVKNPETNLPYTVDEKLGIMVYTEVEADGLTYEMFLPVMDPSNKAMKLEPYSYQVWDSFKKQFVEKTIQAATMFDINKTLMRCLVKNLAMFGLGLYIYAGEDIPEQISNQEPQPTQEPIRKTRKAATQTPVGTDPAPQPALSPSVPERYKGIQAALNSCRTIEELVSLYKTHLLEVEGNPQVKELFTQRKDQLAA